jgi:hypothetical protein
MKCELCKHEITWQCHAASIHHGVKDPGIYLCHPDYPSEDHHDCYHLYTVWKARSKSEMRRIGKIIGK